MSFADIEVDKPTPREPIKAGSHIARCYSVIDLGTQSGDYKGDPYELRKIYVTWELPGIMKEFDGEMKPQVIGKEYTLSFGEKANLQKDLTSWFAGNEMDGDMQSWLDRLQGKACMLNVIHKTSAAGNVYAKITAITPLPNGIECGDQFNPDFSFELAIKFDNDKFDKIPKFLQEKIIESPEYETLTKARGEDVKPENPIVSDEDAGLGNENDDLPF